MSPSSGLSISSSAMVPSGTSVNSGSAPVSVITSNSSIIISSSASGAPPTTGTTVGSSTVDVSGNASSSATAGVFVESGVVISSSITLNSSIASDNHTGTSSHSTSQQSTSTSACPDPSATSDGEIPLTYECKVCDGSTDIHSSSFSEPDKLQAWQAADANDALAESLRWYNLARWGANDTCPDNDPSLGNCSNQPVDILPDEDNYIQAIQTLWSSDQSIECTMTESACQTIECEQGKYPCNYLITNSFVNFANLLRSQYNGLQQAQSEVSASMPSFADTFAPVVIDSTADTTKDLLDGFASAFGVFSAFSWNKILKDMPFFKKRGNDHGWMKGEIFSKLRKAKFEIQECYLPIIEDTTNSLVSTGVTTAKDQVSRVTAQLGNQNNLSQLASQWTDALLDTMEPFLDNMQNGSLTSNQALNSTLFNGVFMELGEGPTYEDMRDSALQVLYSQLLIPAWRLVAGAENLGPIYPAIL
ncbi:MAG: hypothetical protein M1822_003718 [Bathelium mastoideum]|nr:MAG: hypothetical protein M1822_003718 [Bathelium mastoideum]